ncbi:hypothetical protein BASA61_000246 [Batrachochytrium salamandrivorans]|nr:hypothetical protein BASA61_000246 [Batrachochytrium salamandrivorans]
MDGSPHKEPIYGLIMELVSIETQKQPNGKSASTSTLYKLLMELLSIDAIKPPAPTLPSGNILKRTFRMLSRDTRSRLGQSSVPTHSLLQESSTMQPILNSGLEATAMPDSPPTMTSITTQELTELGSLPDPHQPQLLSRSSKSKSIFKFRFRLGRRDTTFVSNTGLDEPRDSTNTVGSGSNSNRSFIGSAVDAIKLWLKTNTSKKSNVVRTALLPATPLASVV